MRDIHILKNFSIAGLLLLFVSSLTFASSLIEPTRTTRSTGKSKGKLTISSEPPRLDVKMDGTVIGETPVVLMEVEPGIHVIQVVDSETEIFVEPGKSLQLSWFKGAFIQYPEEVKKEQKQQREEQKKTPQKIESTQSVKKNDLDPFYWPLNPRGPIY
jgi:hypothetical protein